MAQNKKKAPPVPPASGPPSLPRRRGHQSPEWSPQSSPPLSSSSCPLLFVQPGRITWGRGQTRGPNHPGFHLRPTFLDDALTNRVGIKPCPKMKLNDTKKAQKTGTDCSFDHLLGTPGPLFCLNAWTALTHWSVCGHAGMSHVLWEHSAATAHATLCLFSFLEKLHWLNQCQCPDTFLSQELLMRRAP